MSWIGGECQVAACGHGDALELTTNGTYATHGTYGVALVTHGSHVSYRSHPWLVPRACKRAEPVNLYLQFQLRRALRIWLVEPHP